jgi:hypothetical protein
MVAKGDPYRMLGPRWGKPLPANGCDRAEYSARKGRSSYRRNRRRRVVEKEAWGRSVEIEPKLQTRFLGAMRLRALINENSSRDVLRRREAIVRLTGSNDEPLNRPILPQASGMSKKTMLAMS